MLLADSNQIVGISAIDVDIVVVRTHCKHGSTGRVLNSLNPLFGVIGSEYDLVELINRSTDCQSAIIMADCDVTIGRVVGNGTSALGIWERCQG